MRPIWDVCLTRRITENHKGHYEIVGGLGQESVVVELDREVISSLPIEERIPSILANLGPIQRAARRLHRAGRFYPVYYPWSDRFRHHLIALTSQDLVEA